MTAKRKFQERIRTINEMIKHSNKESFIAELNEWLKFYEKELAKETKAKSKRDEAKQLSKPKKKK